MTQSEPGSGGARLLIPALWRRGHADTYKFKANLVYIREFQMMAAEWDPVSNTETKQKSCSACGMQLQ